MRIRPLMCAHERADIPRFAAANLNPQPSIPGYEELVAKLAANDKSRLRFFNACLSKLGLEVNHAGAAIPPLSSLHLSSLNNIELVQLLQLWEDIIDEEDGQKLIKGEGDIFDLQDVDSCLDVDSLQTSLPGIEEPTNNGYGFPGADSVSKKIITHEKEYPQSKHTPQFKHGLYYSSLHSYRQQERDARSWGSLLMYGEVLMSTNTLLEKSVTLKLARPMLY
jgi:biotin---protein ligase